MRVTFVSQANEAVCAMCAIRVRVRVGSPDVICVRVAASQECVNTYSTPSVSILTAPLLFACVYVCVCRYVLGYALVHM